MKTPFFRINRNNIFIIPKRLLKLPALRQSKSFHCRQGICYRMLSVLILHLHVSAIMLFRDRFWSHRLLRCYLYLLRNVLSPVFRLTFSFLFENHFDFPFPILHFLKINFGNLSVLSDSLGKNFAKYCIAPRKDFSCFGFSGRFKSSRFWDFLFSVLFRLHLLRVRAITFCFKRSRIFFTCSISSVFHFLQNVE